MRSLSVRWRGIHHRDPKDPLYVQILHVNYIQRSWTILVAMQDMVNEINKMNRRFHPLFMGTKGEPAP